jgi:hypothetical protein
VVAILESGFPVSVCFCARRSGAAVAAGLETAETVSAQGFRCARDCFLGAGDPLGGAGSALQHFLDERGVTRGRAKTASRSLCEFVERRRLTAELGAR